MITRTASARYDGFGKEGKGRVSTGSGVLKEQGYSFGTRFEGAPGTNPEELVAAAHASCFTMALSFALAKEGLTDGTLETTAKVKLEPEGEGTHVVMEEEPLSGIMAPILRTPLGPPLIKLRNLESLRRLRKLAEQPA